MRQTSERNRIPELQGTLGPPTADLRIQPLPTNGLNASPASTSTSKQIAREDLTFFLKDIALERNPDSCRHKIGTLNSVELARAQVDRMFRDRISDWAKAIVLRERDNPNPAALIEVARKLSVIYQAGINFEGHREQPYTTQTLIYALQTKAPRDAVKLTTTAVECGATISPTMVIVTLRKALESAHAIEDLKASGKLAIAALNSKEVCAHPDAVGSFNVITAKFCQHEQDSGRFSPLYKEDDIVDTAHRMVIGAQILRAIVDRGLVFDTEDSQGRVNMSIRALAAVAAALHVEGVKDELAEQIADEHKPQDIVSALREELDVDLEWRSAELSKHQRTSYASLSLTLLESAIDVTDRCLVWKGNSKPIERYKLEGSTVNSLFYAVGQTELPLTLERLEQLHSILVKAVHVNEMNSKLYSKAITAVINEAAFAKQIPEDRLTSLLVHLATEAPYVKISTPLLNSILKRYEAAHLTDDSKPYPPPNDFMALRRIHHIVGKPMQHRGDSVTQSAVSTAAQVINEHATDGWFSSLLGASTPGLEILRRHANDDRLSVSN